MLRYAADLYHGASFSLCPLDHTLCGGCGCCCGGKAKTAPADAAATDPSALPVGLVYLCRSTMYVPCTLRGLDEPTEKPLCAYPQRTRTVWKTDWLGLGGWTFLLATGLDIAYGIPWSWIAPPQIYFISQLCWLGCGIFYVVDATRVTPGSPTVAPVVIDNGVADLPSTSRAPPPPTVGLVDVTAANQHHQQQQQHIVVPRPPMAGMADGGADGGGGGGGGVAFTRAPITGELVQVYSPSAEAWMNPAIVVKVEDEQATVPYSEEKSKSLCRRSSKVSS